MTHHRSKEEQLRLGERAAHLKDVDGLKWKEIAERLSVCSGTNAKRYYDGYKISLLTVKPGMSLKRIKEFSSRHGIERGYVWLHENGFRSRVPEEVRMKIEEAKFEEACGQR